MSEHCRVFDERDDSTVYEGTNEDCISFLKSQVGTDDFIYLNFEKV